MVSWAGAAAVAAAAVLGTEDAAARAALPEIRTIPAAPSETLTPAAEVPPDQFARWTRSQGDNGARRYSALTQITKANVRDLETRLSRSLGSKVNVADRNGKGNLQIHFTSYDELDRLLERLLT